MTEAGFTKLIAYLEGAFRDRLEPHERDAYWLTLAQDQDADVMREAIAYTRSERARYGFPKPGDLVEHSEPYQESIYITAAREFDTRYGGGFKQLAAGVEPKRIDSEKPE